ncbi:MAG: diguanylate cyclase [Deltaproteobacteria bacterium]|nr:diguanylate cyclase [Deltaproteobacteria bacterium]
MMKYGELLHFLQYIGKDPSRLIFEDELTGIYNRRFLHNYFQYKVSWESLEDNPLSLIMMDMDHFKQINDTYGHQVGDQALIWVAGLLKEVAGDENLPIRYAGDEFLILLPRGDKREALQVGERLLQRLREDPLRLDGVDDALHITLSIGISSAPEDAQNGMTLIHKADIALYYAKKTGRNRLANAGEIAPQDVFNKTALHQLEREKIAGRRSQLEQVAESLKTFSKGQSQFMIVEGAAGMGKSTFLETVRCNLTQSKKIGQVKVTGIPQEMFRPYALTTTILVALLNRRRDKGAAIFESLSLKEIAYLTHILPQLGGAEEVRQEEDESALRKGIFNTLLHFIPKIANFRPLVLLIDDLHFSDEATLILLRQLILRRDIPLFICGTSSNSKQFGGEEQVPPLERFYAAHHQELDIRKVTLTPLSTNDIANLLRGIFPQVDVPENFEKDLAQISQGNPLFLVEILRKLVLDQKIALVGQQWIIESLEEGYLPRSLEEIVNQRIAALNEESRQMLQQASTFGEDVSLSVLTGSSEKMEAKVLEFVDQAVTQGLISTNFQLNDEMIGFLSKRILEIAYGGIQKSQKQDLHERIGNYQETLYQQALLPSAATLAYHFKRSANQEKARNYEQLQAVHNSKIFDAPEAISYTGERRREVLPPGTPLDPASLAQIPAVIRYLLIAVRSFKLYPQGSKAIASANRQLKGAIDQILDKNEHLTIFQIGHALMVNSQRIDITEFKSIAESLIKFLNSVEVKGIAFHRGLSERELKDLFEAFARIKLEMIDRNFWQRFSTEKRLKHIELQQVYYTVMVDSYDQAMDRKTPGVSLQVLAGEQRFDQEDLTQISEIVQCILISARGIKLYPTKSKIVSTAIEQLMEALRSFLNRRRVLTLVHVGNSLLANNVRLDTSGFEWLADSFLKFLDSIMLTSLTFLEYVSTQELKTFIGALGQLPTAGLDSEFWRRFAKEQGLSHILFDQIFYEARVSPISVGSGEAQPVEEPSEAIWETRIPVPDTGELFDSFPEVVPDRVGDLLLKGDEKQVQQIINQLFQGFHNCTPLTRKKAIDICRSLLEGLTLSLQHHLAKLIADPLLDALSGEKDLIVLSNIANLLLRMSTNLIQFAEYPLTSQILLHLHRRHRQLEGEKNKHSQMLAKVLDKRLEPSTQKLIMADLKSGEPARQKNAAQLLGSLGRVTVPLLIDIIKQEEDFRVRHIAASLLAEMGPKAAELLKRELVLDGTAEERRRILEIIDTVASDLKTELAFALADENPMVRKAAFQLAERMNNDQVIKLLLDYVNSQDVGLAVDAIECLGKLKSGAAVKILASVLKSAKEQKRLVACCRALGQIADPAGIEPLTEVLAPRGLFFFRKRPNADLRATAASALAEIYHSRVVELLSCLVNDRDPRVREIARTRVTNKTASPP